MPRLTEEAYSTILVDLERKSKRAGYALALEEMGPKPVNEAQAERFRDYYRAKAAEKFP
jgi:hypothetical protein